MAYTKTNWVDNKTPINSTNLNNIENGIEEINNYVNGNTPMGNIVVENIRSKNLLNENTITQGGLHATTGKDTDGTTRIKSNFIEVEVEEMVLSYAETNLTFYGVFCYDTNRNFLGNVSSSWETTPYVFTPLENTKYVRFLWKNSSDTTITPSDITNAQLETGNVVTNYSKHIDFDNKDNYSTDEIVIGTWIDGKPLYRKVINFGTLPTATTSSTSAKNVAHNISNVDLFTKISGIAFNSSGATMPLPYPHFENVINQVTMSASKTNVTIGTGTDRSSFSAYVILEYTKTTD